MEHIIKFVAKNKEILFCCDSRGTRNGFAHDATLFINGIRASEGHCYYLNRTWEHWRFQTVCLTAVQNHIDVRMQDLKDDYKAENGISRVVGDKRKAELQAIWDSDSELILYRDIKQTLRERCF